MKKRIRYLLGWVVFFFVLTFSVGVWLNWTKQQPPPVALGFWIMFVVMAIPAAKKATRKQIPPIQTDNPDTNLPTGNSSSVHIVSKTPK